MKHHLRARVRPCARAFLSIALLTSPWSLRCQTPGTAGPQIPAAIREVMNAPIYANATWGLRVIDLDNHRALLDLKPEHHFFIGSVRKVFSVGELLNEIGPGHHYDTPVYRRGDMGKDGVLDGDLILVASGDLTVGGRTNPDGTIAISSFDHNEANSLHNAVLTAPDPLAGYAELARQVAAAGITKITGDVVIDDRLFQPFNFRDEFLVRPIFVNDDAVDLTINPGAVDAKASVIHRPVSAALGVTNALITRASSDASIDLVPEFPQCIGHPGCTAEIKGDLGVNFVPPLTDKFPVVRTFRIVQPSNYARSVFIEVLKAAGVSVAAPVVAPNPEQILPLRKSYPDDIRVALLKGQPYSQNARLVLKVSYNIGADTSLVLFGLTQGVDSMDAALRVEKQNLSTHYGIDPSDYFFVDGSGGGQTKATNGAVTHMLEDMYHSRDFAGFFDALPILGIDGSLTTFKDYEKDPSLSDATGKVRAKTGTFLEAGPDGNSQIVRGQAFGGYIETKSGRRLAYQLVVNDVPIEGLDDLISIFQNEATISAILWRDY